MTRWNMSSSVAATAVAAALGCSGTAAAQIVVKSVSGPPGEEFRGCIPDRNPCVFTDLQGENTYTVTKDSLIRTAGNKQLFKESLGSGQDGVKLLFAGINKSRTEVVVAFEQVTMAASAYLNRGLPSADQAQRSHW